MICQQPTPAPYAHWVNMVFQYAQNMLDASFALDFPDPRMLPSPSEAEDEASIPLAALIHHQQRTLPQRLYLSTTFTPR